MFVRALKYPLEDEEYIETLVIGSLLLATSILILPAFVLMGYFTRVVRNASNGEKPPRFEDYKGLCIDGVKLLSVSLIYLLGLMVLMLITAFAGEIDRTAGLVVFWILLVPAYFGLMYVATAILYHFSREGGMRDAFDITEIVKTAVSLRYLVAVLLLSVVGPILFSMLQLLLAVTILGLVLVPATLIYEMMCYSKIVGEIEGATRHETA